MFSGFFNSLENLSMKIPFPVPLYAYFSFPIRLTVCAILMAWNFRGGILSSECGVEFRKDAV